MAISPYLKGLRDRVGGDLLLIPSVAVMAFDGEGRLLLVRATDTGRWQTVGGAIDPGETPAVAALRETVEETGLEVELVRVVGCYGGQLFRFAYPNGHLCEYVATVFEARPRAGALKADGEETSEVGWFTAEAAAGLDVAAHTRFLIDEAFRRDPGTRF